MATPRPTKAFASVSLDLRDGTALLVYPTDRAAYSRLCRLLTLGKGRAGKGGCDLDWRDLAEHGDGLLAVLVAGAADAALAARLERLRRDFRDRAYLALCQEFGYAPGKALDLTPLRSVMFTGSILHDRQFEWVARAVKPVPVQSISGGTDVIGWFVLGSPELPV